VHREGRRSRKTGKTGVTGQVGLTGLLGALGAWFATVRRARGLPWRETTDPYAVWLSEVMLQQTRAPVAIPYYQRFLAAFPTVADLAEAREEDVLSLWSGLGYYRRARMLHAAARQVVTEWGGAFPREPEQLRRLRGVGAYTAGAVASIAFRRPAAVVDGNVTRVLSRLFAVRGDVRAAAGSARIWELAQELVAQAAEGGGHPGDWNQALMELGATVCVPGAPRCDRCPVASYCAARTAGIAGELPLVRPKRKPPVVARAAVVLMSTDAVLLARRRPETLFGGLWEPPSTDGGEGALAALSDRLDVDPRSLEPVGQVVHVLTHRRFEVDVVRGPLPRKRRWLLPGPEYDGISVVPLAKLTSLAHASLARKVLALATRSKRDGARRRSPSGGAD
jgi:A/G-specific adenine glycosylase